MTIVGKKFKTELGLCAQCIKRFRRATRNKKLNYSGANQYTPKRTFHGLELLELEYEIVWTLLESATKEEPLSQKELSVAIYGPQSHDFTHAIRQRIYVLNRPEKLPSIGMKVQNDGRGYYLNTIEGDNGTVR